LTKKVPQQLLSIFARQLSDCFSLKLSLLTSHNRLTAPSPSRVFARRVPRMAASLQAISYKPGSLRVLDQLKLPHEFVYDDVSTCKEAFDCIKAMRVRGISRSHPRQQVQLLRLDQALRRLQLWPHSHWLLSYTTREMVSFLTHLLMDSKLICFSYIHKDRYRQLHQPSTRLFKG
jgi:hypothetical protein